MPAPQTFKNHTRFLPLFHFVLMPILLANLIMSFAWVARHHRAHGMMSGWGIVVAFALILTALTARSMALAAQNRVIRLEERIRLAALGVPALTIGSLTMGQMIALRFASDSEAPALAHRAVAETLTAKQIKQAVVTWKPDYNRV